MKTRRTWRTSDPKRTSGRVDPSRVLAATAGALRGRTGWAVGSVLVLVLGLLAVWLFVDGERKGTPPDTRARAYQDKDACLLTDDKGVVTGAPAAPVWEGMQQASQDGSIRVTYVPVMGEQSAANARPFLNGLVQRDCEVVVASGAPQAEVAAEAAEKNPGIRFVVVGGGADAGRARPNLERVADGSGVKDEIAEIVSRLAEEG